MAKEIERHSSKKTGNVTLSQGREALVGSLFRCDSALHATNPPKPAPLL